MQPVLPQRSSAKGSKSEPSRKRGTRLHIASRSKARVEARSAAASSAPYPLTLTHHRSSARRADVEEDARSRPPTSRSPRKPLLQAALSFIQPPLPVQRLFLAVSRGQPIERSATQARKCSPPPHQGSARLRAASSRAAASRRVRTGRSAGRKMSIRCEVVRAARRCPRGLMEARDPSCLAVKLQQHDPRVRRKHLPGTRLAVDGRPCLRPAVW